MAVGKVSVEGEIGLVEIDSPPVNALGVEVRKALFEGFEAMFADPRVGAVVLICGGRTFFAGADISEFGKPPQAPELHMVLERIENGPKPVVAAIHGAALGGGYELALVCHHRIASPSAQVGLPEVLLGLLPGAGGTQRLPRIVGPEAALDLVTSGRRVKAPEALSLGMIDAMAGENRLREDAMALARTVLAENRPLLRVRDRQDRVDPYKGRPEVFAAFRASHARGFRGYKAPASIVDCIQAAVELPFDEGLARERELFVPLLDSVESAAQRHVFFAEREAAKIPDAPSSTPTLPIRTVGVIGAGTMGGGIAMTFLNAGLPVTLVETTQAALDRGLAVIRGNYERSASRGKLSAEDVDRRMGLVTPALDLVALAEVDLVIEAVFEEMTVKTDVFGRLDRICRPGAILASNTSYLDLDAIAAATSRPEWVVGLHFFSPANVMRLLEVVRGAATSQAVIATAMKLAKTIGKVAVLSRVCHGFIANRIMSRRGAQAYELVLEGPTPTEIDRALYDYGFAMGPFHMADLVGLDVIGRDNPERTLRGDLVAIDRLGQKRNGGFYDYSADRKPTLSPIAADVIAAFARHRGVAPTGSQGPGEIVSRLLYPVVNEGAKLLEEGIALRASDIDVAAILGYNWPVFTGGPMFWADTVGLPRILEALKVLEARHGEAFRPARLLEQKAAAGGAFTRG